MSFELCGQRFEAISAGPMFTFNEAISFMVRCDTQDEIDHYWDALTRDGGQEVACGWVKDRFGLSWQVVPSVMDTMMREGTDEQVARLTAAFLQMKKFDLAVLRRAYQGNGG